MQYVGHDASAFTGSDSGVIVACTVMGLCFWLDRKQTGHWEVYFLFLAAVALGMCRWGKWMLYLGTFDILLQDGIAKNWQPGRMDSGCSRVSAALGACRRIPENKKKYCKREYCVVHWQE